MAKMNPSHIDLYQAAFGGGSGEGGEDIAYAQVICKKIQSRIEKKALNKGLGLNEDGTSEIGSTKRRMT